MPMKDSIHADAWIANAVGQNQLHEILEDNGGASFQFNSGVARIRYPNVVNPRANSENPNAKPKYSLICMLTPWTQTQPLFDGAVRKVCADRGLDPRNLGPYGFSLRSIAGLPTPFHDGSEKPDKSGYTGGCIYFSCASDRRPYLRTMTPDGQVVDMDPTAVYDGMWGLVHFNLYCIKQKGQIQARLCAGLIGFFAYANDTQLGGNAVSPERAFRGVVGAQTINVPQGGFSPPQQPMQPQYGVQPNYGQPQPQYQQPAAQPQPNYGQPPYQAQPMYQPQPQYQPAPAPMAAPGAQPQQYSAADLAFMQSLGYNMNGR